jgi:hypothetical protein
LQTRRYRARLLDDGERDRTPTDRLDKRCRIEPKPDQQHERHRDDRAAEPSRRRARADAGGQRVELRDKAQGRRNTGELTHTGQLAFLPDVFAARGERCDAGHTAKVHAVDRAARDNYCGAMLFDALVQHIHPAEMERDRIVGVSL